MKLSRSFTMKYRISFKFVVHETVQFLSPPMQAHSMGKETVRTKTLAQFLCIFHRVGYMISILKYSLRAARGVYLSRSLPDSTDSTLAFIHK